MADTKLMEPWLPSAYECKTDDIQLFHISKEKEERINNAHFFDLDVNEEDFSTLCFSRVRLEHCRFSGCCFDRCEFSDVLFLSCDFSNSTFSDSFWKRAALQSSKGTGAKFVGSIMKGLSFTECSMAYTNFDHSRIETFKAEKSDFSHANFAQCRSKNMLWNEVKLRNASFFKTSLKGMDFTTCGLEGLLLSDELTEVGGAIMDLYQAAEIAKRLGIIIK